MSGGGKKVTVGYWYKYLQAFALSLGKLDAVLEFRAGGRTAWRGIVTESSRIYVNAKNLWGGEKKEGGLAAMLCCVTGQFSVVADLNKILAFVEHQFFKAIGGPIHCWIP